MRRALLALLIAPVLLAAEPAPRADQPLTDPAAEARAQTLFEEVRCVVCQHESIADSPAGIAADMRQLVRSEIASGATDDQVRGDLVNRWGDYILFKPPFNPATWLLWLAPLLIVVVGGASMLGIARRRRIEPEPLSPVEEARLAELLQYDDVRRDPAATAPHDGRSAGTTIPPA
ncbi:cytochrome C biogenesis protein [Brevundimonas sp. Leaf363]|uniref:cytochrome c-type biogenesis protein n=1 Tax=Brevundimonas sp. Leaf363 TaxID=1736353 RepID=UPI0007003EB0|nr:cytochrome c-type biogenesis protein [Brevundimonas sp. Leaf363]KQS55311.1 cytochrome C biogenesis protein [Brevundimonas sp. Leaf363]